MIFGHINHRLALPGLSSDDAARHADTLSQSANKGGETLRPGRSGAAQHIKRQNNQGIAREHRQGLAIDTMHGWLASTAVSIVKTGQVIVNQGGAVEKFHRRRRRVCKARGLIAAGLRNREAQGRSHPSATGENTISDSRCE